MEKDSAEGLHSLFLSLSHSHTCVHTCLCRAPAVLISGQRYTGTKINAAEMRLQPTETVGLGLEKGGEEE